MCAGLVSDEVYLMCDLCVLQGDKTCAYKPRQCHCITGLLATCL